MDDLQFYETPKPLAYKMANKFSRRSGLLLDPSAGKGSLLHALISDCTGYNNNKKSECHAIEIDADRHTLLKEQGYSMVGYDFLTFDSSYMYRRIIMNPPFKSGVHHVLRAWSMLVDGEMVALVNAETIKNPCDKYRQMLVKIIEDNDGDVEYLTETFYLSDTNIKTSVDVAIIYLKRTCELKFEFLDHLTPDLAKPDISLEPQKQELALPNNTIKNSVILFNAAVDALRNMIMISAKLNNDYYRYQSMLNSELLKTEENKLYNTTNSLITIDSMLENYNKEYNDLKDKAWNRVLKATDFQQKLSSLAMKRLNTKFEAIKNLAFTDENIQGFLRGLIENQGDINIEMLLDTFDRITRYDSKNRVYYRGWKSNDKHGSKDANCYRIRTTRFIIPIRDSSWYKELSWSAMDELRDFDKVFNMLVGKTGVTTVSIASLFEGDNLDKLIAGERLSSEYFDIRYYPGAGTVHYFPTNKRLIHELNMRVGKHRQWLPPEQDKAPKAFWLQYDKAEKISDKMILDIKKMSSSERPLHYGGSRLDENNVNFDEYLEKTCKQLKIDTTLMYQIEGGT